MKNTGNLKVEMHGDRSVRMTRVFNAPRRLVWEAFNTPELMQRWFGPRGFTLPVCEMDVRPGGTFKFVLRRPDGVEMVMRGTYREIVPPERSVHVESYDDFPGESVVSATFTEADGKTTLTAIVEYPSQMVRDNVVPHMEHGAAESYDKLEELLQEQAASA